MHCFKNLKGKKSTLKIFLDAEDIFLSKVLVKPVYVSSITLTLALFQMTKL